MLDARFSRVNLNEMVRREWILTFGNFSIEIFSSNFLMGFKDSCNCIETKNTN